MVSPALQKVVEILGAMPRPSGANVATLRARMEEVSERLPDDVTFLPVAAGGVPSAWISPPEAADRTILYLHGGGYAVGSVTTHRALIARIARSSQARALALNYRLAPEHPFPAAVEDSVAAYRWLLGEGGDPAKIVVCGDSAGGGLTLATLVALRDQGLPRPAAGVALSPWTDLAATGASVATNDGRDPLVHAEDLSSQAARYLGGHDPKTPLASPLYADLQGLPPLLVQTGDAEVLLDDARRVGEKARAAGVEVDLEVWEQMVHGWHLFAGLLPEGRQAIESIGRFVRTHT